MSLVRNWEQKNWYVDDCIILVAISKAADKVIENVSKLIEKKLGHKINMTKSKISKPNTIKYLGFGFNYVIFAKLWKAKLHSKFIETLLKEKLKRLTNRSWSVKWEWRLSNSLLDGLIIIE